MIIYLVLNYGQPVAGFTSEEVAKASTKYFGSEEISILPLEVDKDAYRYQDKMWYRAEVDRNGWCPTYLVDDQDRVYERAVVVDTTDSGPRVIFHVLASSWEEAWHAVRRIFREEYWDIIQHTV